jgi:hypothetical protein
VVFEILVAVSVKRAVVLVVTPCRLTEILGEGSFSGDPEVLEGSGMKITHRGGTTGDFGRVLIYQVLEKALEMANCSTGALLRIVGGPLTGNSEN